MDDKDTLFLSQEHTFVDRRLIRIKHKAVDKTYYCIY